MADHQLPSIFSDDLCPFQPEVKRQQENLPQDREAPAQTVYGFVEPKMVPKGKLSLSQLIELLKKHTDNPKVYTAASAAKEYHLELRDAELILEYYMPLTLLDPENKKDMAGLGMKTRKEYLELENKQE